MNTTAKSFLSRASSSDVTASVNMDKDLKGADPKVIAAAKKLDQHCNITHAQYEDQGSTMALMLVLKPSSDSSVAQEKVFTYPEIAEIAEAMKGLGLNGADVELHAEGNELIIEAYYNAE